MPLFNLTGILLVNLGTPDNFSVASVRKYLKQFLSDPRVIELPNILRWLLLKFIILPFRSAKTSHAYKSIWMPDGSPLLVNSRKIQFALQDTLGDGYKVALGMRYGNQSISAAIKELQNADVDYIVVLPLFPQYASAVSGSALEETLKVISKNKVIIPFMVITNFYKNRSYIQAMTSSIKPCLTKPFDFLLMSFHGLPERQLINPGINCYKTQCLQTAKLIAENLNLSKEKWMVSFQSRLGKLPWIKPYTEQTLIDLRKRGISKLLVVCPSFVVDCLETLEEIGIRARKQWLDIGGESFELIPCLNASQFCIDALQAIVTKSEDPA